jgi:mRNA interferase YafQ
VKVLIPAYKNKFEKDLKRISKQGKNLKELNKVITSLIHRIPLDKKYTDHPLKGKYSDCRECHIQPDWLLIYMIKNPQITFIRTGSHADLFK